jgi:Arc/MetJ-type ribon-helix-helix transcriptional regulator
MNINLALDNDLHDELRLAAFEDRRSQSEIIREAVRQWLDRREAAGREPSADPSSKGRKR